MKPVHCVRSVLWVGYRLARSTAALIVALCFSLPTVTALELPHGSLELDAVNGEMVYIPKQAGVKSTWSLGRFRPLVTKFNDGDLRSLSADDERIDSPGLISHYRTPAGLTLTREVVAASRSPLFDVTFTLSNEGAESVQIAPDLELNLLVGDGFMGYEDPGAGFGAGFYSTLQAFWSSGSDLDTIDLEALAEAPDEVASGWTGWVNAVGLVAVRLPTPYRVSYSGDTENGRGDLMLHVPMGNTTLLPGELQAITIELLVIPKDRSLLTRSDLQLDAILLINFWDWFRELCRWLWILIAALQTIATNWGIAIILLAVLVRLVTIPVTRLSVKYQQLAVAQQVAIAPLLVEIKQKYQGIEQSEHIVNLYDTVGYDHLAPFKAMLGLTIQIPIFIALFNLLGEAYELRGESFLWISDLARSDRLIDLGVEVPYFGRYINVLPLLMALVTALSTRVALTKDQVKSAGFMSLYGMASVFFLLFYSFPAALVLYWMTSNFCQLLQQLVDRGAGRDLKARQES